MNNWNTIQNELLSLNSGLPSQKIGEAYSVPEGYFDHFASSLIKRLQQENISVREELAQLSPLLSGISKNMPYSVPNDYFQKTDLLSLMEEEQLPSVLLEAGREMPYEVPAKYFDELPGKLLSQVKADEGGKVVSMFSAKWMRIAAAAMVAGIITISSISYFSNKQVSPNDASWVASKLKNVTNQDLEEFIKTTEISTNVIAKTENSGKVEVRSLLKDVPDHELEQFLNTIPTDTEDL